VVGRRLFGDRWSGATTADWSIENPTLGEFERAIEQLDGSTFTMLSIATQRAEGTWSLTIGGGPGGYVVIAQCSDGRSWNLKRLGADAARVMVNAGGQEGDFHASQVVTKTEVLAAGRHFWSTGELDRAQPWKEDRALVPIDGRVQAYNPTAGRERRGGCPDQWTRARPGVSALGCQRNCRHSKSRPGAPSAQTPTRRILERVVAAL
jgi:hypothetical protein